MIAPQRTERVRGSPDGRLRPAPRPAWALRTIWRLQLKSRSRLAPRFPSQHSPCAGGTAALVEREKTDEERAATDDNQLSSEYKSNRLCSLRFTPFHAVSHQPPEQTLNQ